MESKVGKKKKLNKENLKQRAYLNSITSLLDYAAKLITGFIVTPFLVNGLGSMLFGVWQVLGQFAGYTSMADIRATQVLKWAVAKDRDAKCEEELRQYVTATFLLVLMVVPLLLIAGAVITWYSPVITGAYPEYVDVVRIACALLILGLIIQKLFGIFESILRGMNLGFKRMGLRAVLFMIGGGLKVAVILMGYGLIALALVQIFVALSIGITLYVVVKSNVPWYGWGKIDFKKSLSFLKVSGWFMGWTGAKMLITRSDKILLGFIASPVLVTQYVVTKYLMDTVNGLAGNITHGVVPGMGKLYGNEEFDKLFKAREHIMLVTWLLAVSIGTVVLIYNNSFLEVWIGEGQFAGQWENLFIILMIFQYVIINNDQTIINTTLDIKHKVYLGYASGVTSIGIVILLIDSYGIVGLCIGIIIGRMIMSIGYPWIIYKKTGRKLSEANIPFKAILTTIALFGSAFNLDDILYMESWLSLIGSVAISWLLVIILAYYIGLNKRQRNEIWAYKSKIKFLGKGN